VREKSEIEVKEIKLSSPNVSLVQEDPRPSSVKCIWHTSRGFVAHHMCPTQVVLQRLEQ